MIFIIAGARPNFVKIAPIIHALGASPYKLVHTGQHYDYAMSQAFFDELNIPIPNIYLNAPAGSQTEQTAGIMLAFEKELLKEKPSLVLVVGDVNSTMACTLVAKKFNIPVAHVEAGIRSYDMTMPEEINRLVTDSISDLFFTTTLWASNNLINSGIAKDKIFFVGNVMIDTLLAKKDRFSKPLCWDQLSLNDKKYFVLTLHRPSNVDNPEKLDEILTAINKQASGYQVVFPVHPRTRKMINQLAQQYEQIKMIEPMGYLNFNYLVQKAIGVITDSGGITEETTVLGVPCITIRTTTERPETVEMGTNELIGDNPENIAPAMKRIIEGAWKAGSIPEKWDGKAAERIVKILEDKGYFN